MNETYHYSRYRYTGPDMKVRCPEPLRRYVVLMKGDEVTAEMDAAKAKILSVKKLNTEIKVSPVYVIPDYLEYIKPASILFSKNVEKDYKELMDIIQKDFDKMTDRVFNATPYLVFKDFVTNSKNFYHPDVDIQERKSDFEKVLDEMADIHVKKDHDYGNSFDELYDDFGNLYAYMHLKEKMNRIKTLRKSRQQVKQESLRDSLLDLASYSVMWIVKLDNEKKDGE